jgi:hypothetical protein
MLTNRLPVILVTHNRQLLDFRQRVVPKQPTTHIMAMNPGFPFPLLDTLAESIPAQEEEPKVFSALQAATALSESQSQWRA